MRIDGQDINIDYKTEDASNDGDYEHEYVHCSCIDYNKILSLLREYLNEKRTEIVPHKHYRHC